MNRTPQSICILRLSAIGDVTHVLPVVATLQNAYPQCKITWVIGKLEYKLMQGMAGIEFVVFDKSRGRTAYKELKNKLKNQIFDVLLQMQYSFRANRAAWLINAKQRIGFDKKRSREFHSYKLTQRIAAVEKQHVLDSFMEFPKAMGVKKMVYKWHIEVNDDDVARVKQFIKPSCKNIIISPCSSSPLKDWSISNYVKIVDYVLTTYNVHVILCGGASAREIEVAAKIERLSKHTLTNITGKDTLKQLFALMLSVDLVVSPDSGPMHMASAAGTPVIGLHAATTAKRSGAYNFQELAVDCFDQAVAKFLKKTPEQLRWGGQVKCEGAMDLITFDAVKQKIDLVMKP